MTDTIAYHQVEAGTVLPDREFTVLLDDLVRYCGASSDFTGIHWNQRVARSVGLPDVIAQSAFTVSQALRCVTDWVGDPSAVVDYRMRVVRPVVVPDDGHGATLRVSGVVKDKLDAGRVKLLLTVRSGDKPVLSGLKVTVQL